MQRLCFAAALCFLVRCNAKSDPADYSPGEAGLPKNPRTCAEIRGGILDGSHVLVDGSRAECPANDVVCSLADVSAFAKVCAKGVSEARCVGNVWFVECAFFDAGTVADASPETSPVDDAASE